MSGSSLGGVIWPIALKSLLYKVGFAWGVRIAAFIMLPLLGAACLSIRLPIHKGSSSKTKPKPDLSIVKHPVLILLAVGLFFIYLGLFSPFFYITSWTLSLDLNANMAFYSRYSLLFPSYVTLLRRHERSLSSANQAPLSISFIGPS